MYFSLLICPSHEEAPIFTSLFRLNVSRAYLDRFRGRHIASSNLRMIKLVSWRQTLIGSWGPAFQLWTKNNDQHYLVAAMYNRPQALGNWFFFDGPYYVSFYFGNQIKIFALQQTLRLLTHKCIMLSGGQVMQCIITKIKARYWKSVVGSSNGNKAHLLFSLLYGYIASRSPPCVL